MTLLLALLALFTQAAEPPPTLSPGTIAVRPPPPPRKGQSADDPFGDAVLSALSDKGFTPIPDVEHARYVATVTLRRVAQGSVLSKEGSSAPLPMMSAGGGGVSVALGSGKARVGELVQSEMDVRLSRRGDAGVIWQGRVTTNQVSGTRADEPRALADRLATALFRNFPQPSGLVISVP
jgi:hypothetical protein